MANKSSNISIILLRVKGIIVELAKASSYALSR
jgi:hypothetical protein